LLQLLIIRLFAHSQVLASLPTALSKFEFDFSDSVDVAYAGSATVLLSGQVVLLLVVMVVVVLGRRVKPQVV